MAVHDGEPRPRWRGCIRRRGATKKTGYFEQISARRRNGHDTNKGIQTELDITKPKSIGEKAMRLTLRTLLAYLDNTLEPDDAAVLKTKIDNSPRATELIARIRSRIDRADVSAPSPDAVGPLDNANRMSEYLDSMLSVEQIAEIEQLCQESDISLAEAASCHQILALALGHPTQVPDQLRERVYGLPTSDALKRMEVETSPAPDMSPATKAAGESIRYSSLEVPSGGAEDPTITLGPNELTPQSSMLPGMAGPNQASTSISPVGPDDSGVADAATRLRQTPGVGASAVDSRAAAGATRRAMMESEAYDGAIRPSRITPWLVSLAMAAVFLFALARVFEPMIQRRVAERSTVETEDVGDVSLDDAAIVDDAAQDDLSIQPDPPEPAEVPVQRNEPLQSGNDAEPGSPALESSEIVRSESDLSEDDSADVVAPIAPVAPSTPDVDGLPSIADIDMPDLKIADSEVNLPDTLNGDASALDRDAPMAPMIDPPSMEMGPSVSLDTAPSADPNGIAGEEAGLISSKATNTSSDPGASTVANDGSVPGGNASDPSTASMVAASEESDRDDPAIPAPDGTAADELAVRLVGPPSMVLVQSESGWQPMKSASEIAAAGEVKATDDSSTVDQLTSGHTVIAPPLYRPTLSDEDSLEWTLVGPTRLTINATDEGTKCSRLDDGRMILASLQERVTTELQLGPRRVQLVMPEPQTLCAIELATIRLPGMPPEVPTNRQSVYRVLVLQGTAELSPGGEGPPFEPVEVQAGQQWRARGDQAAALTTLGDLPDWVDVPAKSDVLVQSARDGLVDFVQGGNSLEQSLREAMSFRRVEVAALAAETLLMLGRADVYFGNDGMLSRPLQRRYWTEHFQTLRRQIALSAEAASQVRQAVMSAELADGDVLFKLLIGFSPKELANGGDAQLVEWLDSPSMPVRVLAIENLRSIVGDTLGFRPDQENAIRRAPEIRKWEARMRKGDIRYGAQDASIRS
ncbi:MAG: hypothetical protein AAF670_02445 [Planctomycetota bacterium]